MNAIEQASKAIHDLYPRGEVDVRVIYAELLKYFGPSEPTEPKVHGPDRFGLCFISRDIVVNERRRKTEYMFANGSWGRAGSLFDSSEAAKASLAKSQGESHE